MMETKAEDLAVPGEACPDARHRFCAVSRCPRPIHELIRFVEGPDGTIVPDLRNTLPGRGIWVTATHGCVVKAMAIKAFQRGLKRPVVAQAGLPDLIAALLDRRALEALSFVNKAGALILGFERVAEAIQAGKAFQVLHASDAAADGVRKLNGKRAARAGAAAGPSGIDCFSNAQLSLALGRPNVVHAALLDTPASRNFVEQTGRSLRYRSG